MPDDGDDLNRNDAAPDLEAGGSDPSAPLLVAAPLAAPAAVAASATAAAPAVAPPSAAPAAPAAAPKKLEVWQKPGPNKKSYMPTFAAPEAYGKKADPKYAMARKEADDRVNKEKAKLEKAKKATKKKKKEEGNYTQQQDNSEDWKLLLLVILGIFTALAEALDLDVLIGILLMPFMTAMKAIAAYFGNVNLDPQTWIDAIGNGYNSLCKNQPAGFIAVDFTIFAYGVTFFLFQADIDKYFRDRALAQAAKDAGYEELEDSPDGPSDETLERLFNDIDEDGSGEIDGAEMAEAIAQVFGKLEPDVVKEMMKAADTDADGTVNMEEYKIIMRAGSKVGAKPSAISRVAKAQTDPDTMMLMLRNAREELEEVNIYLTLRGEGADPEVRKPLKDRQKALEGQVAKLAELLSALQTEKAEEVDLEAQAAAAAEAEAQKARQGGCADTTKLLVSILKKTISGVLTIYLYFMDLISDFQVTQLYYNCHAYKFAAVSASLLIGQFLVVWLRVLPYLSNTYGTDSTFYKVFLYFGMPLGCFFFDFLMFLGPFGLLPYAPMPEAMRLFVPAYGATRMIAEVLVEALPQWIMQSVIFVIVSRNVRDGTASEVDNLLYTFDNGNFIQLMPKSILLSSLTMLKTWYDLVQEAREAGISVALKGIQLWNVGAGLPLDAIKAGSITSWACAYEISDLEAVSLVDALGKNDSLVRLNLSLAGFEWMPPIKREERSAISTLLTVMQSDEKALESLETFIISQKTKWGIPVLQLRAGPEKAFATLMATSFLSKDGPQREEMHAMFELLCKNRNPEAGESELEVSYTPVVKIFSDSQKAGNSRVKRENWQKAVAQLMSKGMCRRAHFKVVMSAEVLRNVSFGARELLDIGFTAKELKEGFFEAKELTAVGFTPLELKNLGYTPKEMWEAEIPAKEMCKIGYNARELKDGGYTAQQMKNSQSYTLDELREGRYKALELGEAGYLIPDLRAAQFTAMDLRKALIFSVQMMRDAGYTAQDMKKAGYECTRILDAGYSAQEASDSGYTIKQMYEAGYAARGVRMAGHSAVLMREAGYDLISLKGADFQAWELMEAGYTAQEIKEAGTSLVQLKAAGTPMISLKDIGYTAQRLKQQGYTAAEIALGARGRVDMNTGDVLEDSGGYTAKEMRGGPPPHITASELRKGKVFFRIEEWRDGAWPTKELREGGYSAYEMKVCGYLCLELRKSGYSVQDLVDAKFAIIDLKAIGATAGELKLAGIGAKALSEAGYTAKELLVAGFTAAELIACGYGVGALREAGFDAIQLRKLGFSLAELKAYGYGAGQLKDTGAVIKELHELGFSLEELLHAGFTARAVAAVDGRAVYELKEAGYAVRELREYGYVVADMRGIYSVKDLKDQGFSLKDLREGGIPEHAVLAVDGRSTRALRHAGYESKVLRKVGFHLHELAEGDYTATELKAARYYAEELRAVGFTAGALRVAGFTSKQLRAAGYTLRDMCQGGFFWKDLVIFLKATHAELTRAGYKNLDPKHELFLLYRPTTDEVYISRVELKMREGSSLDSAVAGKLAAGSRLVVLQRADLEDGTQRVCVAKEEESSKPLGWVSVTGKDGIDNLAPDFLSPRQTQAARLFDIEGAAARVKEVTAAVGSWASSVWTAAGAWAEAAAAATGSEIKWDEVGPAGVKQRASAPISPRLLTKRASEKGGQLTTPRAANLPPGVISARRHDGEKKKSKGDTTARKGDTTPLGSSRVSARDVLPKQRAQKELVINTKAERIDEVFDERMDNGGQRSPQLSGSSQGSGVRDRMLQAKTLRDQKKAAPSSKGGLTGPGSYKSDFEA